MLEVKNVGLLDSVFPSVAALTNTAMCKQSHHLMTLVHTDFCKILHLLIRKNMAHIQTLQSLDTTHHRIQVTKTLLKEVLDAYRKIELYTMKFHLLDRLIDDLDNIGCLELLSSSPYEYPLNRIKRAYCWASQPRVPALDETTGHRHELHKIRMTMRREVWEKLVRVSTTDPFPVRNGFKTTLYWIDKAFQMNLAPKGAELLAANQIALLEANTKRKFVSLLKDLTRQPCSQPLHDNQL